MSRLIRCRRCGALFVPDRTAVLIRSRRRCPRCRGPLPPSGGVPAIDDRFSWPHSAEVVA
jgi:hypothetical protein